MTIHTPSEIAKLQVRLMGLMVKDEVLKNLGGPEILAVLASTAGTVQTTMQAHTLATSTPQGAAPPQPQPVVEPTEPPEAVDPAQPPTLGETGLA